MYEILDNLMTFAQIPELGPGLLRRITKLASDIFDIVNYKTKCANIGSAHLIEYRVLHVYIWEFIPLAFCFRNEQLFTMKKKKKKKIGRENE